ncbi:Cytochrome P450 3A12 [Trichoplax sp. H2]|uniref:Cytochrome P450 n=1 Tax=Trichoplax adhaerens TaxID=10228 RepID=B3RU60_TRIAD|nr:hypothetical protein TRIADDRAFT_55167 [Trichoplax adhaerens]EDV25748.1 hypothetical protein TRIADDRAFT_55167 [Trichoplax adhaerens]RDD36103.1 Cytochrome P450 3A12 [Trichoplax sp. H2]|eukprot:XP_002111781.1 hypothetical protein TRIADDRAFT_55167 [Trichoplax adhaerens]
MLSNLLKCIQDIWELHPTAVLVALIAFLIIYFFYHKYVTILQHFIKLGIPGPKPWPILGNVPEIGQLGGQHLAHMYYIKKYGKVVGLFYGTEQITLVSDYEMIKKILVKNFHLFPNRRVPVKFPFDYLNKALTVVRDQEWKNIRDTITPTFSANKLKAVLPIVDNSSQELRSALTSYARQGEIIDARKVFGKFTMEVILSVAFGVQLNTQDTALTDAASKLFSGVGTRVLLAIISPYLLELIRSSPLDFEAKYFRRLDRVARQIIKERRQSGAPERKDLLQLMLDAQQSGKLSDDDIVAQSFVFLLAGYETTASTLSFISYLLALNPDVQEKLINEIDDAFSRIDDDLSYEQIYDLKYLDMVIAETLRLYPPAPILMREAAQDCTIGDYQFIAGTSVLIPTYALQRDSTEWPDPEKFIPERFTQEEKRKRNPMSYLPFGTGPRICIGMRFALMEVKIALVTVLRAVKFIRVKETEVPLHLNAAITISPKNGIKIGLEGRCLP